MRGVEERVGYSKKLPDLASFWWGFAKSQEDPNLSCSQQ